MSRVIDNPLSGERIVIRQSGAETDGEVLVFDLFLQPGGHVPARHLHPQQEERFTVVAGQLQFRVGRRRLFATPSETIVVPPGTPHWFGNRGPTVAQMRVEVRPALRMEELFATTITRRTGKRKWLHLADLALILLDFQSEVGVPDVPAFVVRTLLTPLAWVRALAQE